MRSRSAVLLGLITAAAISGAALSPGRSTGSARLDEAPRRVILGASGPEVVRGRLRLHGDAVYELQSDLTVVDGELVLDPGTRVEAAPGTRITVQRTGRILADGTHTRPIVLTCAGTASPGCWGGLVINGFATLNTGPSTSPSVVGRDPTGGCRETSATAGAYGGCIDADSSGVLRNVWIQGAGAPNEGALSLRGVGSATLIESVQVFKSSDTGVEVLGGAARLRRVRISQADSVGVRWGEGWRGRAQYVIVQAKARARAAIEGSNLAGDPASLPRSAPILRNFTIVGPPTADTASGAASVWLHSGSAGTLQRFFVSNRPAGGNWLLDVDGAASWDLVASGEIRLESSFFAGLSPLGAMDDDPPDPLAEGLYSPDVEGHLLRTPSASNRVLVAFDSLDLALKSTYGPLQDLRPRAISPVTDAPCSLPLLPTDAFFEDAPFCGALANNLSGTLIPWNEPGPVEPLVAVPPAVPNGYLFVLVTSPDIGAIGGARLVVNGFQAVTDGQGYARMYTTSGFTAYTLQNLPQFCTNPGLFFVNVPANGSVGQTATVSCGS